MQNAITTTDFYKVDHINQYPKDSNKVYSNFTPRSSRLFNGSSLYDNKVLNFGMQITVKNLKDLWNKTFFQIPKNIAIGKYKRLMQNSVGEVEVKQFEALHDLGYLPIIIKSLPEGTRSSIKVPVFTITNTLSEFYWLTNYLETYLSTESWKRITMATIAFEFRRVFEKYADLTNADKEFIKFQGHDFSMRGLSSSQESFTNLISHLTCFVGTDTIPAIEGAEYYYNANMEKELIGTSVFASEHSTITMNIANYIRQHQNSVFQCTSILPERAENWRSENWKSNWQLDLDDAIKEGFKFMHSINDNCYYKIINNGCVKSCTKKYAEKRSNLKLDNIESRRIAELEVLKYMITKVYPTGIYSHVSDSYDYWYTINVTLRKLKDIILSREVNDLGLAKLVIRPDSGDPEKIICGLKIAEFNQEQLDEIDKVKELNNKKLVNYAKYYYNADYYSGFKFDSICYDWNGNELSDEEVKGSLNILWEIFGGSINSKGFKVLNPRIGLIYGDSITIQRQEKILERMMRMGFASSNIVLGIGSYSYQFLTRDTLGFAMKATYGKVNDQSIEIFKDPKTDAGTKKSAKGLLQVIDEEGEYKLIDQVSDIQEENSELQVIFKDGEILIETTLQEIRNRIDSEFK